MSDSFTADQVQGIFGEFKPVLDDAVSGGDFSDDNVQGIFGIFLAILDEAAGEVVAVGIASLRQLIGTGQGTR